MGHGRVCSFAFTSILILFYKGEIFMKKLALVLGSLLVIGSVASAKEVMPAPMPEPEVKIVEKPVEVIVYRDRVVEAPAKWRPNGSVDVQYRWYGETENRVSKEKDGGEWARSEEHTSELQSRQYLVCRLLLEKKK